MVGVVGGGFPDEGAEALLVGEGGHDGVGVGGLGVDFGHDEMELGVASCEVGEVGFPAGGGALPALVAGESEDVELDAVGEGVVDPGAGDGVVAAFVDVEHGEDFGIDLFDGGGGVEELGELVPVFGGASAVGAVGHEAGGDFISDLDHVGLCAGVFELLDDVAGVVVGFLDEVGEGEVFPRGGGELFAGVGPGVGVVEVEEEFHAGGFDAFGHGDGVGEVAEAGGGVGAIARGGFGGIDEEAEADVVEAVGF